VIFKAGPTIQLERRIIAIVDFHVNRVDAHLTRLLLQIFDSPAAKAAPSIRGRNIELVDKSIVAMKFS